MHPTDAAARAIANGDMVRVLSVQGETRVPVSLSNDIVPGAVSLPEGLWVDLDAQGVDRGGAANMLTATDCTAPGAACIMHGVAVHVSQE